MTDAPFHVAAAGLKGMVFLHDLRRKGRTPERVYSYSQPSDASDAFCRIKAFCIDVGAEMIDTRRPELTPARRTFFIGWQYLFHGPTEMAVVFHDSLLPELRGFAPTATAIIAGMTRIGVTAFRPDGGVDTGPVYIQDGFDVAHPMRIADALQRQAELMAALADRILDADATGSPLCPTPQDEANASYSIWRDGLDFNLDPHWSADEIVRRVYALGHPYNGARLRLGDENLVVLDAVEVEDLHFVIRDPGKVWRLDEGAPVMICGSGMVSLTDLRRDDGSEWTPPRLRLRFERPTS